MSFYCDSNSVGRTTGYGYKARSVATIPKTRGGLPKADELTVGTHLSRILRNRNTYPLLDRIEASVLEIISVFCNWNSLMVRSSSSPILAPSCSPWGGHFVYPVRGGCSCDAKLQLRYKIYIKMKILLICTVAVRLTMNFSKIECRCLLCRKKTQKEKTRCSIIYEDWHQTTHAKQH